MTVTASTISFLCIFAPGLSRSRTIVVIPALYPMEAVRWTGFLGSSFGKLDNVSASTRTSHDFWRTSVYQSYLLTFPRCLAALFRGRKASEPVHKLRISLRSLFNGQICGRRCTVSRRFELSVRPARLISKCTIRGLLNTYILLDGNRASDCQVEKVAVETCARFRGSASCASVGGASGAKIFIPVT